jgi:hypothetical protein
MSTNIGIWIGVLCTIACYSFLYKENLLYRLAEHLFVGVGAGYAIVMGFNSIKNTAWNPMVENGQYIELIPIALGILLFSRFFKSYKWLSRIPMSLIVGTGVALSARGSINAEFVQQIRATIIPLTSINNILVVLGTIGVLSYFFFNKKYSRIPGVSISAKFGRYVMMAAFGAAFGNGVMGRVSLLIARLQYVFGDWISLIK